METIILKSYYFLRDITVDIVCTRESLQNIYYCSSIVLNFLLIRFLVPLADLGVLCKFLLPSNKTTDNEKTSSLAHFKNPEFSSYSTEMFMNLFNKNNESAEIDVDQQRQSSEPQPQITNKLNDDEEDDFRTRTKNSIEQLVASYTPPKRRRRVAAATSNI